MNLSPWQGQLAGRSPLDKIDFKTITIIGLGLMGGSLALALKRYGFQGEIVGVGRRVEKLEKAKNLGIIDRYWTDPSKSVKDSDLVVLASHVGSFIGLTSSFKDFLKKGSILTDLGSVKANLVQELEAIVPDSVNYVGAHPIAGSEKSGIEAADPNLFHKARCIITPTANTDSHALKEVCQLWESVGSRTILMSCDKHDLILGAVSHLPHIAAYALINTITTVGNSTLSYGGAGLRDTTRIASSSAELWQDICFNNKNILIQLLENFESHLSLMRQALENNDKDFLQSQFEKAQSARMTLEQC